MDVINRQPFVLGPEIPKKTVTLLRDIDYFNTILHIEHGPVPEGTQLYLELTNRNGQVFRTPILLGTRGDIINYQLHSELAETFTDFMFSDLKIECNNDISVGISATNQVGGFM